MNHLFHSSKHILKRLFFFLFFLYEYAYFTFTFHFEKCCLKLSRISDPSEGGQNKTPGNLIRVLGWHGPSFWGQVCLLSGPVEGNCLWLHAQLSARQRQIIWTPVFFFPNCCKHINPTDIMFHSSPRHPYFGNFKRNMRIVWSINIQS